MVNKFVNFLKVDKLPDLQGELANMVYAPDRKSGYSGSLPGFSTFYMVSCPSGLRESSAKGMFTSSNLVLTFKFSCGATAARLILVQEIVVRIHAGKLDL
jgi:hypothetical protein